MKYDDGWQAIKIPRKSPTEIFNFRGARQGDFLEHR